MAQVKAVWSVWKMSAAGNEPFAEAACSSFEASELLPREQ